LGQRAGHAGKERFDDLVAEDEAAADGPNAGRIGYVTTRPLDAVNQLLALQFCQIVGGVARGVGLDEATRAAARLLPAAPGEAPGSRGYALSGVHAA
jgi:hypothetical protein